MKKILVTGGAGFVGSHLVDSLLEDGYFVYVVDNLITGSEKNIEHLKSNENFKFIKANVSEPLEIDFDLDFIFHLASPASPADFTKIPEEIALTNSLGAINVLKLAKESGARILMTSTSEAYGDPKEHPQKETYWGNVNTFGPRACYDESKRFSETMSYIYLHKYNLNVRIIRIFNTYGPRMRKDDGRAVSNFINQAIKGETIVVHGDGEQTRSFCYVSDMVEGIGKVMFGKGTKGEIFNLGNPDEYTMNEFVKIIKKMTESKSDIKYEKLPKDDPKRRRPDISKVRKVLNWEPKVKLEEGLKETIKFYKEL